MKSLANVLETVVIQPTRTVGVQASIAKLANAHRMTPEEMTGIWRGAGLIPPTDEDRITRYCASKLLVQELLRRGVERLAQAEERAINLAWSTTQLEGLAQKRPTVAQLLGLIKDTRLQMFAEKFDPDQSGGALILGPTGKGKSIAVLCLMIRCMVKRAKDDFESSLRVPFDRDEPRPVPVTWASFDASDLGQEQQHAGLSDPDPPCVARAKTSHRLILEDLGWERAFHVETLLQIAAPRYRRGLPTFVTSGERHEALRERYTDAVLRRFWNVDGHDGARIDLWT